MTFRMFKTLAISADQCGWSYVGMKLHADEKVLKVPRDQITYPLHLS
jgi:hypothetical protein